MRTTKLFRPRKRVLDLDSFPQVVRQECESPTERRSMARKSQEYHHETEIIFALPSLQMNLQTKHVQDEQPPREDGMKISSCLKGLVLGGFVLANCFFIQ